MCSSLDYMTSSWWDCLLPSLFRPASLCFCHSPCVKNLHHHHTFSLLKSCITMLTEQLSNPCLAMKVLCALTLVPFHLCLSLTATYGHVLRAGCGGRSVSKTASLHPCGTCNQLQSLPRAHCPPGTPHSLTSLMKAWILVPRVTNKGCNIGKGEDRDPSHWREHSEERKTNTKMGNPVSGFSFNTNGSVGRGATGASAGIYSHARVPIQ